MGLRVLTEAFKDFRLEDGARRARLAGAWRIECFQRFPIPTGVPQLSGAIERFHCRISRPTWLLPQVRTHFYKEIERIQPKTPGSVI
jgi:hypothetical protein